MSKNSGGATATHQAPSGEQSSSPDSGRVGRGKDTQPATIDFTQLPGSTDPRSFMMHVDTVAQNMAQDWSANTRNAIDSWRPGVVSLSSLQFWVNFGMGLWGIFVGTNVALRLTGLLLRPIAQWANRELDRSSNGNANNARATIRRAFNSQYQSIFRQSTWREQIEAVSAELYPALAREQPSTYTRIIRDAIRDSQFIEDRESQLRRDIHRAMSAAWAEIPRATDNSLRERIHEIARDQRADTAQYHAGRMNQRRYLRRRQRRREAIQRIEQRLQRRLSNREVRILREAGFTG